MHSHFLLLVLFAFFVSLILALIGRDDPKEQLRFGGGMFVTFVVAALVLGWVLYPFPLR